MFVLLVNYPIVFIKFKVVAEIIAQKTELLNNGILTMIKIYF